MKILILETSSEKGCIVLAEKGAPLLSHPLAGGPALSKTLALETSRLLCKAVLHMAQPVDLVAVGIGPGSYTGIRVGAALGKALAYGWGVPLVGFCSLKAFGSPPVLVDARGAGIYALLEEEPVLLAPTDPRLQELGRAISPNPEAIKKRLPIEVEEKGPNPMWLAEVVWRQFLEKGAGALELNYASFP